MKEVFFYPNANALSSDIAELRNCIASVERIFDAPIVNSEGWEVRYELIFGIHKREVCPLLEKLGLNFDWYDPDTSYEEDVSAYVRALVELKNNLP